MRITQHRPAFCSGFTNEVVEFKTTEELLNIPFVKKFSDKIDDTNFYRYSLSAHGYRKLLMAEYNEGTIWWVVGYIDDWNLYDFKLPDWKPIKD